MPQLDGLRGIAVLAVQWYHFSPVGRHALGATFGEIGVGLFFVLSGFLISGVLIDASTATVQPSDRWVLFRHFYIRRLLRLAPLFYVVLIIAVVLNVPTFRENWGWHAFYASNFYQWFHGRGGYGSNLWSLAVEEQFYLFWPLLIVFLPLKLHRVLMVLMVLAAPLFRMVVVKTMPAYDPCLMLPSALDFLGAGSILAAAERGGFGRLRAASLARAFLVTGILVVIAVQWFSLPWYFRQTGFALCFGWFVGSAGRGFSGWTGRFLSSHPMVFMGKISYGVYVWQGFALFYWYWLLDSSPLPLSRVFTLSGVPQAFYQDEIVAKLMALIITLVAALASYWFLESPIHSLRRHFPYSRKRPAH